MSVDSAASGGGSRHGDNAAVTTLHDAQRRGFASDNYSGVHPEVLAAIAAANGGHQSAYGNDVYTERLQEVIRGHFGEAARHSPSLMAPVRMSLRCSRFCRAGGPSSAHGPRTFTSMRAGLPSAWPA
jgi:hypothetical protein